MWFHLLIHSSNYNWIEASRKLPVFCHHRQKLHNIQKLVSGCIKPNPKRWVLLQIVSFFLLSWSCMKKACGISNVLVYYESQIHFNFKKYKKWIHLIKCLFLHLTLIYSLYYCNIVDITVYHVRVWIVY